MNRRIVINGATGEIGAALAECFIKRDDEVFAIAHVGSKRIKNIPVNPKVHIIECNISDIKNVIPQIEHADVFYQLAWQGAAGPGRNDMYMQLDNVRYALDAVEAAHELGCTCYIGAGSQAEYGRVKGIIKPSTPCFPENGYGMAKLCAGEMTRSVCQRYGIRHIWPRIFSVYGPCDNARALIMSTISALHRGERAPLTKGEQIWDFLYSRDAGEIMARFADNGVDGKVYCVGSGKPGLLSDYMKELLTVVAPDGELGFGDIPYGQNQVMHLEADISDIQKDLGYIPSTDFKQGIKETAEWIRNNQ